MPSKVHAKFKIAAKVKPKLIVDRTYHLGSNLPHLVRDNGRALLGHAVPLPSKWIAIKATSSRGMLTPRASLMFAAIWKAAAYSRVPSSF